MAKTPPQPTAEPEDDPLEPTSDDAKQDALIQKGLAKLDKPQFALDSSLKTELDTMYIVRTKDANGQEVRRVPKQIGTEEDLKILADLTEENQAKRDRVTEIKVGLYWLQLALDELWEVLERHLVAKYPFIASARTKDSRYMLVSDVLEPLHERIFAVKRMYKVAEMIEGNLNNTHFSLKEISDLGKVIVSRKPLPVHRSV